LPVTDSQLVSVVIPAYNAAATLDETLRSVRSQTHRALEIIVVDDGSSDDTHAIAERHASADDRVQVLTQLNSGVAAARNAGWHHARSDLIAFVDADDLWAPSKIRRQMQVLQAGGERVGLVYCWSVRIDSESRMYGVAQGVRWEGDVLQRILLGNFVRNGSAALVRRQALIDAHGFDSGLRAAGAEGCEDFLFYCRVAEKHHYAVVPEHLVGYRYLPYNMSSNRIRMLRSWLLVVDEMLARHPEHNDALIRGFHNYSRWVVQDLLSNDWGQLPPVLSLLLSRYPSIALRVLLMDVPISLAKKVRNRLREVYRKTAKTTKVGTTRHFFMKELD
jgi:glycosyltransferase involved in cell wall biosynthesis